MSLVSTSAKSSGSSGAVTQLFSSTLGANAATIDTGANGIAQGYSVLEAWITARTTEAVVSSTVRLTVNGDTAAHYDRQAVAGSNTGASAGFTGAAAFWQFIAAGGSATAGEVGIVVVTFPMYAVTTFNKQGSVLNTFNDQVAAGNNNVVADAIGWRSTAAINQLTVTAGSGNLLAGSSMVIYGRT